MARAFKCPCGDRGCKKWMVSPGADIQGAGWDKATAKLVAELLTMIEENQQPRDDGQPDEQQEWRDYDPEC